MADVRSVAERFDETQIDQTFAHDRCIRGMKALSDKLRAAFLLQRDPACEPFMSFASADGGMRGSIEALRGGPIDWAIDSWIGSPERGFTNHHLTAWLDPSIGVPHLGLAVGTIPQVFMFCDLVPRSDLWVNTAEMDRYHARFNDRFMAVSADERFSPFISREIYIREAASPTALCQTCAVEPANFDAIFELFDETVTQWIAWVKEAEATPLAQRQALGERDRLVRRTICERDPANLVAERVLGADMTQQLVQLLAGTSRDAGRAVRGDVR